MSGPIVRTGTTPQFWKNWDNVFGGKKGAKPALKATAKSAAGKGKKKSTKSAAGKKAKKSAGKKK